MLILRHKTPSTTTQFYIIDHVLLFSIVRNSKIYSCQISLKWKRHMETVSHIIYQMTHWTQWQCGNGKNWFFYIFFWIGTIANELLTSFKQFMSFWFSTKYGWLSNNVYHIVDISNQIYTSHVYAFTMQFNWNLGGVFLFWFVLCSCRIKARKIVHVTTYHTCCLFHRAATSTWKHNYSMIQFILI